MQTNDAQATLESLIEGAKSAGADAADAVLYHSVSTGVSWRMGNLEDVSRSESAEIGLRVIVGQRQATVSTTDFAPDALKELSARCAAMAKTAPEDPYCGLAPIERLASPPHKDLDLGDYDEPSTETLKSRAADCERAALAVAGVTNSSGAGASYGEGRKWLMTSSGFFGESGGSNHSVSVSVLAKNDDGMERDYDYDSKTHFADLRDADAIGRRAGEFAVRRLSPKKIKSRTAPVMYDNRLSRTLLGSLAGAVNGGAIARGVSYLKDKRGERIFPESVNIIDDPHRARGAGSRPFDGEGVTNARIDLIKNGVLTEWFLNSAQAKQLGLETNARATRGAGGAPGSGSTNLFMEPGEKTPHALMTDAGEGLLVTDMFGPQVNANTGDYSVGCSGFWFVGGEIAYPVSEITIAGNILDMFSTIQPANNLEILGSMNAPSLLISQMTIAGD